MALAALAAGCGATSVTEISGPDPVRCQVTLASSSGMVGVDGGSLTVNVDSARDCTWNASSEAAWATLAPTSGQGAGAIAVTVAASQLPTVRTATIVVNNQRLDIPQEARPCRFTLSDARAEVGAAGGQIDVSVTAGEACSWRPFSTVPWIVVPAASRTGSAAITFDVAANPGGGREGSVTIGDQTFSVVQSPVGSGPMPCTPLVQPASIDVAAAAATDSVQLDLGATCEWTAASGAAWLTLTPPVSGRGAATIRFSIAQNAGAARNGTLTIAGQVVTVRQTAAAAPPPCTYTIDPASRAFATAGGEGRVQVTARAGCDWTAASNASWAVLAATRGSGNSEVGYTVQSNATASSRTARLTIGGRVHTITQAAAPPPCTFTLAPSAQTVGAGGGAAQFRVTTQGGCQWMAQTTTPWLSLTSGAGSGTGDVTFTVAAHTATTARTGTVTVGDQTHTVTQSAAAQPCTYSLAPPSRTIAAAGGQAQFRVVTQAGCAWSAVPGNQWVEVATTSGAGPADVTYTVQANSGAEARSSNVTVAGERHTITQEGAAPACTYAIAPQALTIAAAGGEGRFTVTTQAGCAWMASGATPWMTFATGSGSGTGTGDVVYNVQANTAVETRMASIVVNGGGTHTVTQTGAAPACTYAVAPLARTLPSLGGEGRVTVTTQPGCAWTATGGTSWLTLTTASGSGTGDVVYSASLHVGIEPRSADIQVGNQVHTVTQAALVPICSYTLSPPALTFTPAGGEGRVTVTTLPGCGWSASAGPPWITVTNVSGSGTGQMVYTVQPNAAADGRATTLIVAGQSHDVTQGGTPTP